MPIYEYQCQACDHKFEARQKFSDEPLTECPKCKGSVKKIISQTAFSLKGGGWYQQGYGAASSSTSAPACPAAKESGGCAGCPKAANS